MIYIACTVLKVTRLGTLVQVMPHYIDQRRYTEVCQSYDPQKETMKILDRHGVLTIFLIDKSLLVGALGIPPSDYMSKRTKSLHNILVQYFFAIITPSKIKTGNRYYFDQVMKVLRYVA